jgi:hypothetical protein
METRARAAFEALAPGDRKVPKIERCGVYRTRADGTIKSNFDALQSIIGRPVGSLEGWRQSWRGGVGEDASGRSRPSAPPAGAASASRLRANVLASSFPCSR